MMDTQRGRYGAFLKRALTQHKTAVLGKHQMVKQQITGKVIDCGGRLFANTKQQAVLCSPFSGTFSLIPTCLVSTVSWTASLETGGVTDTHSETDNTLPNINQKQLKKTHEHISREPWCGVKERLKDTFKQDRSRFYLCFFGLLSLLSGFHIQLKELESHQTDNVTKGAWRMHILPHLRVW